MAHILFIAPTPFSPWKGTSHRVRHDLEALTALGHSVDLLMPRGNALLDVPGVTFLSLPHFFLSRGLSDSPSFRRVVVDTLLLLRAVSATGRKRYALIHGIDNGGIVAWEAGRLAKIPCVFERTASSASRQLKSTNPWCRLHAPAARRALKGAAAVISNDASALGELAELGCRSRACVIPDIPVITEAPPASVINMAMARYRTEAGQPLVTCVGSSVKFHDLDLLFNAMPHVLSAQPNTRFAVVGGDDAELRRTRAALDKASLSHAVSLPGRIPSAELAALFAVSDVLVSPRRTGHSAPIRVLDYLHSGRPIVAVDSPANRAILSPDNAVITPPRPEALAQGILRICRSPDHGKALAECGRQTLGCHNRTPAAFRQAIHHCYDYALAISGNSSSTHP